MLRDFKSDDEQGRLLALQRCSILDSGAEAQFDAITGIVKQVFGAPICAISLIDAERQWFKAIDGLDERETERDAAFCDHTIRTPEPLVVEDAQCDARFTSNRLVTGAPHIRSYAGAPLRTPDGYNLGALCVIDSKPRKFDAANIAMLQRFADLVVEQMELRTLAHSDFLTGALSRRAFIHAAEAALRRLQRAGGKGALAMFDIDYFKTINDRFGHPAGDRVLKDVAEACRTLLRPTDLFGRLGGEEFGIFMPDLDAAAALRYADRLRLAIAAVAVPGCPHVTASFGVACAQGATALDRLVSEADTALYVAKSRGRNRCTLATAELAVAA